MIEGIKPTREWKKDLSKNDRLDLIVDIGETCIEQTETLSHDGLGTLLAYLFMAIANSEDRGGIQLFEDSGTDREIIDFFRKHFPEAHPIWRFISYLESHEN